ncbi:hypothetical protein WUBG_13139, partial [Wuchereria bancrofti]
GGGTINKTNGGSRERETFSSPQVGIELQSHHAKCRVGSASSPLNAMLAAEKPAEGNAVNRNGGNSAVATATTPAVVAEKMYPEPTEAGENTLSNKVTNNHHDIAACHGMVNYVIN